VVEPNTPPPSSTVIENSPQNMNPLLVKDLKNKLGNMGLTPTEPAAEKTQNTTTTNIVQDGNSGITYSVAPRLDIPRRIKGPAKRPPTNISSSDK